MDGNKEEQYYKAIDGISDAINVLEGLDHKEHIIALQNIRSDIYAYMDGDSDDD